MECKLVRKNSLVKGREEYFSHYENIINQYNYCMYEHPDDIVSSEIVIENCYSLMKDLQKSLDLLEGAYEGYEMLGCPKLLLHKDERLLKLNHDAYEDFKMIYDEVEILYYSLKTHVGEYYDSNK